MDDFFATLSLMRKLRRMRVLTKKILRNSEKRQECMLRGEAYTKEYEALRLECKSLKKTGYSS